MSNNFGNERFLLQLIIRLFDFDVNIIEGVKA